MIRQTIIIHVEYFLTDFNSKMWYIVLESFSLRKNYKTLTNLNGPPDDVACLHGLRTINAIALLLSHKCMQLLYYSYVNRTQMTEVRMSSV